MQTVDLPKVVIVARVQGYCAGSTMSIDDSFPVKDGAEDVVGIGKILDGGIVVGWVYRTRSGKFFLQGNNRMSKHDQEIAGFRIPETARHLRTVSPIVRFVAIGNDLRVSNCAAKEYSLNPQRKL